jgi:dynein-related subfamily AAA family protein
MTTPVKPSQLRTLLSKAVAAKEPALIIGAPGIGKSDIVEQAAAAAGAESVIMHPVVSDPTDFKGLPWVTDGGATFLPFGELQTLITAKKPTVCFLDDLGQATSAVQAAAMQLVLARRVNGHHISKHVTFFGATNRRADRAGVSGILEPLKSRFTIVELVPDLDDWCAWAASTDIAAEVIAFLRFRPTLLSDFQPSAEMTNSPSPRNWAAVSRLLAMDLPRELQLATVEGRVGHAAAGEFVAFLRTWADMVSPDLVLTAPDTAPIPEEPAAMYALSTALAVRVQAGSMERYLKYLTRLQSAGKAEFAAVSLKTALVRDDKLANTPAYTKAMTGALGRLFIGSR